MGYGEAGGYLVRPTAETGLNRPVFPGGSKP